MDGWKEDDPASFWVVGLSSEAFAVSFRECIFLLAKKMNLSLVAFKRTRYDLMFCLAL